jgi:hypothetical protein
MATTIMISTRVNPILPLMLFFITAFFFERGVNEAKGGFI